ncbi:hypothetical protein LSAT2_012569, partial [Lamellibrachia satsuma]
MEQASKFGQPSGVEVPEPLKVNEVRQTWMVRADSTVAEKMQENDFKLKYGQNRQRRSTVRGDIREARRIGSEEERLAEQERRKQKILENAIRAQQLLQEETVNGAGVHQTEQERNDEKIARALQKEEQRHSVEAKTCQHDLAQQCQRQLQKRLSSRTSDDGETEPWEEATIMEKATSSQRKNTTECDEVKRRSMEKEDRKMARALQKEEQLRSFEAMRRQREQMHLQMHQSRDDEMAPDEVS